MKTTLITYILKKQKKKIGDDRNRRIIYETINDIKKYKRFTNIILKKEFLPLKTLIVHSDIKKLKMKVEEILKILDDIDGICVDKKRNLIYFNNFISEYYKRCLRFNGFNTKETLKSIYNIFQSQYGEVIYKISLNHEFNKSFNGNATVWFLNDSITNNVLTNGIKYNGTTLYPKKFSEYLLEKRNKNVL